MAGDRLDFRGQLDLLLLSVLAEGDAHGYAILRKIHDRSGGAFDVPEGTAYPALNRLESLGVVTATWTTFNGRNRKTYSLTPAGQEVLAVERGRWEQFTSSMDSVIRWT